MVKELNRLILTILVLILMSTPVCADDFEDGVNAYLQNDYKTALEKWKLAAKKKRGSSLRVEATYVDEKGVMRGIHSFRCNNWISAIGTTCRLS